MKYAKNTLVLFFTVVLFSANILAQVKQGISIERLKTYENYIEESIASGELPGVVSMIYRNGEVVHNKAFGYSNIKTKTPLTTDGRFYIQSMTKPIISVAFMMLYEEGHFLLTDPVSKYIPAFKDLKVAKSVDVGKDVETDSLKNEITIANLLSHTAGLSHGLGGTLLDRDYAIAMYFKSHKTVQDRMNAMLELPLIGQPGEQWYYSAAPDVLSVLIEQFSGMSTNEFLQKRIFDPLKMKDTGYNIPKAEQKNMVYVHSKNKEGELIGVGNQPKMEGNTIWSGVNGLYSTSEDYLKFCKMLLNKGEGNGQQLLSKKTVELMSMNHTGGLYNGSGEGFGLGFCVVENVAETGLLGSEGTFYWNGANNTFFFIDPKENMIAIFMSQLAPYSETNRKRFWRYVYQSLVD